MATELAPVPKHMNMIEAINSAMDVAMARDEGVVVFGEDVGFFGGVFRVTDGLIDAFGERRVVDTPLAESAIAGMSGVAAERFSLVTATMRILPALCGPITGGMPTMPSSTWPPSTTLP